MGYARFRITFELLRDVLHLPAQTEIKLVAMPTSKYWHDECEITVEHPDIKTHPEGEVPPLVSPLFHKQDPVVFIDWGQT